MSFSAPPAPPKPSRYFENGSPGRCFYCGRPFQGSAIREPESNRYFCSDECLKTARFVRFSRLPRKAS
jgi:hypothetical protein